MKLGLINLYQDTQFPPPPLGLLSIATYLKKYMGFENSELIDYSCDVEERQPSEYKNIIRSKPDLIGISSMTSSYRVVVELASKLKEDLKIPIIIGGVHISYLPNSFSDNFDVGILGEGEETMLELVRLYENHSSLPKKELKKIDGIIFRGKKLVTTRPRKPIFPLDKIPMPDRSLVDKSRYFKNRPQWDNEMGIGTTILTTRGCPYRCVFCPSAHFWGKPRLHSAEHVFEEVKYLIDDYGVDTIHIWDDLFAISKKRIKGIAEIFKKEGIQNKVRFNAQGIRSNLVDEELCKYLKAMNVTGVGFGFESGSEKILNYLKAGSVTIEDHKRAIRLCKKHGFRIEGSLIFGSPGETIEDMKKTLDFIDFMEKEGVDKAWCFVLTPYPGTPIWEIAKKKGKISEEDIVERGLFYNNLLYEPENAMLLDDSVDKEEFKKIFKIANEKLESFGSVKHGRRKQLKLLLKNDPLGTLRFVITRPKRSLNFLKRIT